jgi:hypothetical protein
MRKKGGAVNLRKYSLDAVRVAMLDIPHACVNLPQTPINGTDKSIKSERAP